MRSVGSVLLLVLLLGDEGGAVVSCPNTTDPGVRCMDLVSQKYCMSWKVLETEGVLEVTLAHETSGKSSPWMAVGVSPSGGMRGADIMAVHKSGAGEEWVVSDMFALDYEPPTMDERQHATLVKAEMTGTVVTATVRRPLDSCEFHDNAIKKGFAHPVIWSTGEGTDLTQASSKHLSRGTVRVVLWEDPANPEPVAKDAGLFEVKLQMPGVQVPASTANSYICMTFDLQQLSGKDFDKTDYHMVQFSPLLEGAPQLVHHILLMTCSSAKAMYTSPHLSCADMDLECPTMVVVWAVGGSPVSLPDVAGLQIGKENGKRMWMQVHYYNPTGRAGEVDRSGLTLKITSVLRKEHAAVLALGPSPSPEYPPIPAGEDWYRVRSTCAECMKTHFEKDEVTVVAVMAHAHFAAKKVETHVVRDGKDIGPLYELKRYDYNHQLYVQPRIPTIKRNDVLETVCEYNTLRKEDPTHFGDGSQEEMCFSFVLYYPRQPLLGWCADFDYQQGEHAGDYASPCTDCRGNGAWPAGYAEWAKNQRKCEDPTVRETLTSKMACPPCAAKGTCTTNDYVTFWKPGETICPYLCAMWEHTKNTGYMCSKGFADDYPSHAGGPKHDLSNVPGPASGCSPVAEVRKVSDNCMKHTDCPTGKYCRNGRKVAPEAAGLLWCTDCFLCCLRQDAVGGAGETDRLYRCPQSCGCEQSAQACNREGEVLCRGCCAMNKCEDNEADGAKLLAAAERTEKSCSELRGSSELTTLCTRLAVSLSECERVGLLQCDGSVFLKDVCPVLCSACPKCSLDSTCSRCTSPATCSSTQLDFNGSLCSKSVCPMLSATPSPTSESWEITPGWSLPVALLVLPFL